MNCKSYLEDPSTEKQKIPVNFLNVVDLRVLVQVFLHQVSVY